MSDDERKEVSREFRPLKHEHSDPEEVINYDDGSSRIMINMLGCSSPGCEASFKTTRKRAWHIQTAHPGEYSGPTEDMMFLSDIMKERFGKDNNMGRTYGNLRGKERWQIEEMKDDE